VHDEAELAKRRDVVHTRAGYGLWTA
jgi:hypothetical protein